MLKRLAIAAAILSSLPIVAWAHGPSRQKVTESIEINAPAEKVWALVGNFQDASWIPAVAKTEGTGDNTPASGTGNDGAKRTLTLQGGGVVEEALDAYDAKEMTFSYEITKVDVKVLPVNDYSSHVTVTANGADKSTLEWKGAFYRGFMNNDPPPELNDEASKKAVTDLYKSTLEAVKAKLEGGK
ncbi:Polyketide cyclase/dehydrase [Hyphomicrobium denitrificans ATCC 51888]|uniref:Polyketide cyclase/dehydrase n=1 Tax=Hyphomicrobium denitrificans (strain ATCC 51888 / DSM 1869 / NCIMB 11706 / TK 0415) TaxID=582899 RepID=D8JYG7_HYPDA|nr:SRPBCC family protein [Hyphomicrobium denitrificans]ADJ23419.1 Polyketide cyclase/dehydrase [Hyphomicrobium denitrificans ATCC 51888]